MAIHSALKKIVVTGPESTGKSTLSRALAERLKVPWVAEYARGYCETLRRPYTEDDLLRIAKGQLRAEDLAAEKESPLLICDTDLYVVKVWSEHSFGSCDPHILQAIATRRYDAYLLTGIDTPWEEDPLREHAGERERRYFYEQYKDIVQNSGLPWVALSGSETERLEKALEFITSPPAL